MANMRAIRTRIRSVANTQQITKAMKMVAASKLRKVQGNMQRMKIMASGSQKVLDKLLESDTELNNPLITPRENVQKVCYVIIVGNRGLCGMYNSALFRYFQEVLGNEEREYDVVVCGRWGGEIFQRMKMPVVKNYSELNDVPSNAEAHDIAKFLTDAYLDGTYDEVHMVYQSYVSALTQRPMNKQLLPATADAADAGQEESFNVEYLFEPDANQVLGRLLEMYIINTVYSILLEAKGGEHSARVTAMSSATDNTEKLISQLQLSYNRARQAAITTEISEIVGGAAALKKNKK